MRISDKIFKLHTVAYYDNQGRLTGQQTLQLTGTIIGGPTVISRRSYWTVSVDSESQQYTKSPTQVWANADMTVFAHTHSYGVIYAECPSCENGDMIFYGGDYICAWCREILEDNYDG